MHASCLDKCISITQVQRSAMKGYQDGTNVTAKFREPSGVAFTPTGTTDLDDGSQLVLTMRARNVLMRSPFLTNPDPPGDALVIADSSNNRIRWLNLLTSQVRRRRFVAYLDPLLPILSFSAFATDARKRPGEHACRPTYQGQHVCLRHLAAVWRLQCR